MVNFHPQFIVDENQNQRAVIVPFEEWKKIVEELEELEDIRAYDKAIKNKHNSIPFEEAVKELEEEYGD